MSKLTGLFKSTAAMISAIAALITALVGLAVYLNETQWKPARDPAQQGQPGGGGELVTFGAELPADNGWELVVDREQYVLFEFWSLNMDSDPPERVHEYGEDLYVEYGEAVSAPSGGYAVPDPGSGLSAEICADYLRRLSTRDGQVVDTGMVMCVATDKGRVAAVKFLEPSWTVEAIIWQPS